ncbi:hypothetical protein BDR22DRAFT_972912 [Usnea florida]
MDRHYSTLELSKHDETARAPERDYDATAFELDTSALAPETVPDTAPEVSYDAILPETHGNEKPSAENLHVTKLARKWPWIILGLILAAAIAVGVSVGIWHRREHSLHKPTSVSSPPAPPNPKITPHPNITHAPQYILNDTSLAAVVLSNGDRHLFFQDNTGLIRRAVRVYSDGQWNTGRNLNASDFKLSAKPKKYTPLTATGPTGDKQMSLYYVSESNDVSSNILMEGEDSWYPDGQFGNFSTAVDTRSLSISSLETVNNSSEFNLVENSTTNLALLFYENPNGKVSALLHRLLNTVNMKFRMENAPRDQWIDITSQDSKALPNEFRNAPGFNYSNSLPNSSEFITTFSKTLYDADPNAVYSTPFLGAPDYTTGSDVSVSAIFCSPLNLPLNATSPSTCDSLGSAIYKIGLNGTGNFSLGVYSEPSKDYTSIRQSDIATFGLIDNVIWINGTQPTLVPWGYHGGPTLPSNEFPFKRLASFNSADGLTTFLYHQMNGTTFAEEVWDDELRAWSPTQYITVSDS